MSWNIQSRYELLELVDLNLTPSWARLRPSRILICSFTKYGNPRIQSMQWVDASLKLVTQLPRLAQEGFCSPTDRTCQVLRKRRLRLEFPHEHKKYAVVEPFSRDIMHVCLLEHLNKFASCKSSVRGEETPAQHWHPLSRKLTDIQVTMNTHTPQASITGNRRRPRVLRQRVGQQSPKYNSQNSTNWAISPTPQL
ncbi:predicted protein [Uncinocarpus reesii 1704]|uniref:Uncharacterized protein n=1 Tax=Uncinocarpus reesii (strain UAMH 1704) TaxID=336963 RepID=C4JLE9_UNCRE|nr:uncharacterized protein UREG_03657 [Uncinocarpus reesii 1704]EEP78811.1 predicted protein [Uncinocarpus reesii 1704]